MTPAATPAPSRAREILVVGVGVLLGFALSRIGFTSYDELTAMFTFADARLFLVFGGAVVLTAIGLFAIGRWRDLGKRPFEARAVVGGVVFGVGWAVCGACPGAAFAQLGEGKLWALVTIAGIFVGTFAARRVLAKASASAQSCE